MTTKEYPHLLTGQVEEELGCLLYLLLGSLDVHLAALHVLSWESDLDSSALVRDGLDELALRPYEALVEFLRYVDRDVADVCLQIKKK